MRVAQVESRKPQLLTFIHNFTFIMMLVSREIVESWLLFIGYLVVELSPSLLRQAP